MTTRNLEALFNPSAIALIGASNQPGSIGATLARNLFEAGFQGPILTVNPKERAIRSSLNYASIADLPIAVDLAVLACPPDELVRTLSDLGAKGCRAAVIVNPGFCEQHKIACRALRQDLLDAARPHMMRLVGPESLGFISTATRINASFAPLMPRTGDVAFLSQSGGMAATVLDWAEARSVGFSHVVTLGDQIDVDFGDLLDHLALDVRTRAILLFMDSITDARKFMSAGRIAARTKPVIVIKSGRSAEGAEAARSHTGALAGADLVYDAAFRRAGMLRVHELREIFEAITTLSCGIHLAGDRLAILTNAGGAGVLATDAIALSAGRLAQLSADTLGKLDAILPPGWSGANPVNIRADADGKRYEEALALILEDRGVDATLVLNTPAVAADATDAANGIIRALAKRRRAPTLTCWLGENAVTGIRKSFATHRIPTYDTPDEAVRAFTHLLAYQRNQTAMMQTPPARTFDEPDRDRARQIVQAVIADGRAMLTEYEAKQVLAAYDIPIVDTRIARTPQEAGRLAVAIGKPVALKILSHDITHKSDVGGVRLDLRTPERVEEAAYDMLRTVAARRPDARIDGFTVQEMIHRPQARELIAGIAKDPTFGPVVLFGDGGLAVEVIADRAVALPPLNGALARELIARTRVARLLDGVRDRPPANIEAIASTLVKICELVGDLPQVTELDINPLLADAEGVIALDARILVHPARGEGTERFAIRPYPSHLVDTMTLSDGQIVAIRPVRPEDEPGLVEMIRRSNPHDVRMRFLSWVKDVPHGMGARMSQIDYDREMALVTTNAAGEILGVVRLISDPDNEEGEYAVMARSDMKGKGLGYRLMARILDYGRQKGLQRIVGDVLSENLPMLRLAQNLGFTLHPDRDDPTLLKVKLVL